MPPISSSSAGDASRNFNVGISWLHRQCDRGLRFLAILASPFKSKNRLEAKNAVLRHQLMVLRRKEQLTNNDHWFLYEWFPSILEVATAIALTGRLRMPGIRR
jgi:hypothetical protein